VKVYFSHPYDTIGTPDEKRLLDIIKEEGWEVINPFENNPEDVGVIDRVKSSKFTLKDARDLVTNDLLNLGRCDAILVWIPNSSQTVGTICEMVYARKLGLFVVAIHCKLDGGPHAWMVHHADLLYLTIDDFAADRPTQWWKNGRTISLASIDDKRVG